MLFFSVGVSGYFLFEKNTSENSVEQFNQPKLTGPNRLCNVFGSILADYSGGGIPLTDVYKWKIYNPSNVLVFDRGGGSLFQTITYTFSGSGTFRVELIVERGGIPIYSDKMDVQVVLGPKINLQSNYSFCEGGNVTMQAIDPGSSNFSDYKFEWRNSANSIVGTTNEVTVNGEDKYSVVLYLPSPSGTRECETNLKTETSKFPDYSISSSDSQVCPDLPTTFNTSPEVLGTWKYVKSGSSSENTLGYGSSIQILPNQNLQGVGNYTISFEPDPSVNPSCLSKKTVSLDYLPQPNFEVYPSVEATNCDSFDGELTIKALTDLDYIIIDGLGTTIPSIPAGGTYTLSGLKSGTYSLIGVLGSCSNSFGTFVPLKNPPNQLIFSIENIVGETCTPNGKDEGNFVIQFQNPPSTGSFRIINEKGTLVQENTFSNVSNIPITIPGGRYLVEVIDENDCKIPEANEVLIPSLNQAVFSVPTSLTICQSYELIPETSDDLEFTITYPDGSKETLPKGEPFTLTKGGVHTVLGNHTSDPTICPTEKNLIVDLVDPIQFEPILINQDCFGNRTYEAEIFGRDPSTVVFSWFNEKDELVGTGQFLNPVSNGTYKLDVQPAASESCPNPPVEFEIKEPVLAVDVTLDATKLCEYGPRAIIDLSTTFPEEITDVEWRRYDASGNIEDLPEFTDKYQVIADVQGIYEVAVFSRIPSINKNCELGRQTIVLDLILDKVSFDVPSELSICEPYDLIPNSVNPLEFELIFPDGKTEIKNWNQAFTIYQAGIYTILGYDPDIKGPLCPEQKTFEVFKNEPVIFNYELVNISCEGEYTYTAKVENYLADQVDYFWRDPSGTIVSTQQNLNSTTYGNFSLEVQPKGSIPCNISPIPFEIPVPKLTIAVELKAETLCPDQPDAALSLIADMAVIKRIEWWFTDLSNNQRELTSDKGKTEILATEEGTYEVRVYNEFDCLLGKDETLVIRSTDQIRPSLEDSYLICPKLDLGPTLNPGSFSSYEWYFGDRLVSNSPIYKPNQIGTYYLIVYSNEGCAYETSFETQEECELRVSFPNAIQPGNPDKGFLIYSNYLIDELEVWILNKWGNEIFQCKNYDLKQGEATCIWDGYYRGEKVPLGTYAVKISYRNLEKGIQEEKISSILVVE